MSDPLQAIDGWAQVWSEGLWRGTCQAALLIVAAVTIARWRAQIAPSPVLDLAARLY